ncbi:GEVED domain-containing protein [Paucihalobacter sp.]|uniref:GEVED domain-containing protein n=1 Tax=Paucihalobacter sp. TaxID=2850405 RepID=UPI002FE0F845
MKLKLSALIFMMTTVFVFSQNKSYWAKQSPSKNYTVKHHLQDLNSQQLFSVNFDAIVSELLNAPDRSEMGRSNGVTIGFPNAEGKMDFFNVYEASTMHPELQARFPQIRSYVGKGITNPAAIIRFSVSPKGIHTMLKEPNKPMTFIEPYATDLSAYVVFTRDQNSSRDRDFACEVTAAMQNNDDYEGYALRNADDSLLRTYRLAVSTTGEYTQYHGGTKALALAAINTTMTRVNGIFENDFNVTLQLIANNDLVIYTNPSTDPYTTTANYNNQLQSTLTNVIGEANYDVGHLFANAQNNGNAGCIGCVCVNGQKGRGWTSRTTPEGDPFDVDYVAHELGHQFGANHTWTFNGSEGTGAQMEPGSGSTIMGYAGITGVNTDVQPNSDPYFHAISIQQVTNYIKNRSCQTNTNTGNAVPVVEAGPNYTIPRATPFVLDGTATDADAQDILTFCWEQFDQNAAATTLPGPNNTSGVAFRSYNPTVDSKRYFPRLETVKTGATSWKWEAVPNVNRNMNFRLTVRDNRPGSATNKSDDMIVTVTTSAGPFVVTNPNTNLIWTVGSTQSVTWNVAGTTGNGVNASTVDIFLSTDGGDTYPIALATGVSNNGSASVLVPNNIGTQNRVMVKGSNHIFFDISNANFTIEGQVACNVAIPQDLVVSNIGSANATVSWTALPGATYDVRYRPTGSSTWNTIENIVGVSTEIAGLQTLTEYEIQVRSKCPNNDVSEYSNSVIFTTLEVQLNYCASQSSNVNDEYIGNVQLNTINNTSGGQFYSDFTNISTVLTKGTSYTIFITPVWTGTVYNEGYSVWIDFNKDGDFDDAGEQVFTRAATNQSPVSGNFTIPEGAVEGATRMRVSMKYNATPTACESFTWGEVEDYTVIIEGSGPDVEAPTAPTNLTASNTTQTSTDLAWNASTDNVGVTGYDVYQDAALIASVTTANYQVTGLNPNTNYSFFVRAKDAAGNISNNSNTVNVTTLAPPDTEAPTSPTNLTATNTTQSTTDLSWNDSTDNTGVTAYDVFQDGALIASVSSTNYQVTGLSASTNYSFTVRARDAAGNQSDFSNTVLVTTIDTQAPTAPTNLTASNITQTTTDLSWNASTDNVGVTGYDVYQSGVLIASVISTNFQVTGLNSATSYSFFVRAKDAAGNVSNNSNTVNITALAPPDTEAPTAPTNLVASNTTETTTDLSWTASSDNVGVVAYDVFQDGTQIASVSAINYQVTGLISNSTYQFSVRARDAANNFSAFSNSVSVTTLESTVNYCTSNSTNVNDEYISRVRLNTIDNASGAQFYSDFTTISTNLVKGTEYSITINPTWTGTVYAEGYAVWIDLNGDGDFTDAGELVFSQNPTNASVITGTFTIPMSAANGATRMRVSMKYNSVPTPCETFTFGEVEDYTVVLQEPIPDNEAPTAPTNLTASNTTQTATTLSWNPSTDNVGVTAYEVYLDGLLLGTTGATSVQITGLNPSTNYSFFIIAFDAAGNSSAQSNSVNVTTLDNALTYCNSQGNNSNNEWIQRVQLGSINNNSGNNGGYADFTALSTSLVKGSSNTVIIVPGRTNTSRREAYRVWIDYNQNGSFNDPGELVYSRNRTNASSVGGSFTVPTSALNGATRMRVSMKYNASPTSCEIFSNGEVEDYTVFIINSAKGDVVDNEGQANGDDSILLFPNPVSDSELNIKLIGWQATEIRVYNTLGQLVIKQPYSNTIQVAKLEEGVYLLELISENKSITKRFVKK